MLACFNLNPGPNSTKDELEPPRQWRCHPHFPFLGFITKNSNPRVAHLSNKLLEMLQNLPRTYGDRIFSRPNMPVDHFGTALSHQRKLVANKIGNPRLLKIHFHTLWCWKGTMTYHETKDMYYVMQRWDIRTSRIRYCTSSLKKHYSKAKQTISQKLLKLKKKSAAITLPATTW